MCKGIRMSPRERAYFRRRQFIKSISVDADLREIGELWMAIMSDWGIHPKGLNYSKYKVNGNV